jgi:hypothetical protein
VKAKKVNIKAYLREIGYDDGGVTTRSESCLEQVPIPCPSSHKDWEYDTVLPGWGYQPVDFDVIGAEPVNSAAIVLVVKKRLKM